MHLQFVSTQQALRRIDAQVVCDVDHVRDEIHLDITLIHTNIEIGERRRMRQCRSHRQQQRNDDAKDQGAHG